MERNEELIKIYCDEPYICHFEADAFMVQSGRVLVHIVPYENFREKQLGAKCFVYEAEAGKLIPSFVFEDQEHKHWAFLLEPSSGEAEILIKPDFATNVTRKKFLKDAQLPEVDLSDFRGNMDAFCAILADHYLRDQLKKEIILKRDPKEGEKIKRDTDKAIIRGFNPDEEVKFGKNDLYNAVAYACKRAGIKVLDEQSVSAIYHREFTVQNIASASGFACREVVLDIGWHKKDCGTLIGRIEDRLVACVPKGQNSYEIYYGDTGEREKLSKEIADSVYPKLYSIGRALPSKAIGRPEILDFIFKSIRKADLLAVLILGIIGALIGILIPNLNQKIYDEYIPLGNYSQLIQMCVVIGTFMLGNLFFDMVKNLSEHRIGSRVAYDLQNAVYFRVFRLPESFLRKFESADMAQRIQGIEVVAKQLSSSILGSGMGAIFSLLYLYKMFKYAKKLAWISLVMLLIYAAIVVFLITRTTKHTTKIQENKGKASGRLYQFISGIDKLRMAGAEDRAAFQYTLPFADIQTEEAKKNRYTSLQAMLQGVVATIFSMVFYFIIVKKNVDLTTGSFMAFNSAFGSFSAAALQLIGSGLTVYQLLPIIKRFKPVFETAEEDDTSKESVEELHGAISLKNVKFSYDKDGPRVLNGINLDIKPGEYIGIVGGSGCGKSTLLKLLLGFEEASEGQVCYDNKDISNINKRALRRNLGVVLQNGQLIAGSIMENITITAPKATMADINRVVEAVGLKDDIAQMPMGLHTMLSENSGTISGGQKQRILIARSIINNPSILIMDEATSALDNVTQAHVCSSLDKMKVTRIVVAHRLSTIKNCDRIVVLKEGKVAEVGNYDELMALGKEFYALAERQIV